VGGRGKRNYVKNGVPFLSSSEMMLFNPKRGCKHVSKTNPGLASMKVSKKDILISRSGTVGNTILVGDDLDGTAISEHALRLVIDPKKISPNYVFCFLKTKYGMKSMEASSFGSVIITLNEDLIRNINMPILDNESQEKINSLIQTYLEKMDQSTLKENQAIDLVEKEIESWQES
jgi:type I restriction enzyme S subunit